MDDIYMVQHPAEAKQQQPDQQQQQQDAPSQQDQSSGWFSSGGWGSWYSSVSSSVSSITSNVSNQVSNMRIDNVINSISEQTNKIGEQLQQTVNEVSKTAANVINQQLQQPANAEASTAAPADPNAPATSTADQQAVDAVQQQQQKQPEESILHNAEVQLKTLVGNVIEGGKTLSQSAEAQLLKQQLSTVGESTKAAAAKLVENIQDLHLYDKGLSLWNTLSRNAQILVTGENVPDDHNAEFQILFQELFETEQGEALLLKLQTLANNCVDRVLATNMELSQQDLMKEIFAMLETELSSSKYGSDADTTSCEPFKTLETAKRITKITAAAIEASAKLTNALTEILNQTEKNEDIQHHTLVYIEKTKAEGYRYLAKIAAESIAILLQLAQQVHEAKSGTLANIPDAIMMQGVVADKNDDIKAHYQQVCVAIEKFVFFIIQETKEVSHIFSTTIQKMVALAKKKPTLAAKELNDLESKTITCCTDLYVQVEGSLAYVHDALRFFGDVCKLNIALVLSAQQ